MKKIVELPCDIGDTVYEMLVIDSDKEVLCTSYLVEDVSLKAIKYADSWEDRNQVGTRIFLSQEDADREFDRLKTLKELKDYKFFYEDVEVEF